MTVCHECVTQYRNSSWAGADTHRKIDLWPEIRTPRWPLGQFDPDSYRAVYRLFIKWTPSNLIKSPAPKTTSFELNATRSLHFVDSFVERLSDLLCEKKEGEENERGEATNGKYSCLPYNLS